MLKVTFQNQGFVAPLDVRSVELERMNSQLRSLDKVFDLSRNYRTKSNVLYNTVHEFSKSPKVVALVSTLIGPDFHCWDALIWLKRAGGNSVVSAHQDGTYWNFEDKPNSCTMWVPLQDVGAHNGSIRYARGSHSAQVQHEDKQTPTNLLYRGQTIVGDYVFDAPLEMKYGEASIHHPFNVHVSHPNTGNQDRYAINFLFVSSDCVPKISMPREHTMHIAGRKTEHWVYSKEPQESESNIDAWRAAHTAQRENYLRFK